jgi:hypothetical protein
VNHVALQSKNGHWQVYRWTCPEDAQRVIDEIVRHSNAGRITWLEAALLAQQVGIRHYQGTRR